MDLQHLYRESQAKVEQLKSALEAERRQHTETITRRYEVFLDIAAALGCDVRDDFAAKIREMVVEHDKTTDERNAALDQAAHIRDLKAEIEKLKGERDSAAKRWKEVGAALDDLIEVLTRPKKPLDQTISAGRSDRPA